MTSFDSAVLNISRDFTSHILLLILLLLNNTQKLPLNNTWYALYVRFCCHCLTIQCSITVMYSDLNLEEKWGRAEGSRGGGIECFFLSIISITIIIVIITSIAIIIIFYFDSQTDLTTHTHTYAHTHTPTHAHTYTHTHT